ncbi:hypothetical protein BGZ65_006098 [Modicella reniformis]|uniref:Uncharacterized protein n=1 Tax=Modicella reniformis TaxID=1440133 RepID=A0A9P6IX11_9FUNG|nr:hypothetical protein BGZ65_006098 [Modicella reniformis]
MEGWYTVASDTLEMTFQDLVMMATSGTLRELESLKINCGGLSIDARFSQGKIQNVDLTIGRLVELNSDYLKFIHKDHLSRLTIKSIPMKGDEDQLVDILRHCSSLSHLEIGCEEECRPVNNNNLEMRFQDLLKVATVDIICKLGSLKINCGGLSIDARFSQGQIKDVNLTIGRLDDFYSDSLKFMHRDHLSRLAIRYAPQEPDEVQLVDILQNSNPVNDFIRQYGWSIVFFDEYRTHNNTFAAILDDIPTTRNSQLESLRFNTDWFKADEFDRLDSILRRSPNFKDLGMYIWLTSEIHLEKAQSLLSRYGSKLSVLRLLSDSFKERLPRIASSFPIRNRFPNMVLFELWNSITSPPYLLSSCVPWIVAMVSAPPQVTSSPLISQALSRGIVDKHNSKSGSVTTGSWTPLKKIVLHKVQLQSNEWKTVIKAIDLSELQYLDLSMSNITHEAFKLLVGRILDNNTSRMQFKTLNVVDTGIAGATDSRAVLKELKKGPLVKILEYD